MPSLTGLQEGSLETCNAIWYLLLGTICSINQMPGSGGWKVRGNKLSKVGFRSF